MTERGGVWVIGARRDWCVGLRHSTPHLTSPLEGGRDELEKEWALERVGSCLRRNDGEGRGGGGKGYGFLPAQE